LTTPADAGTIETLHLLSQLIGKLPTRLHPWVNHGWHVALRMTPRGAVTRPLPAGNRHFTAEIDFRDGVVRVACDDGTEQSVSVDGKTIAEVHGELAALLVGMGLPAPLHGGPNELPDPVPFAARRPPARVGRGCRAPSASSVPLRRPRVQCLSRNLSRQDLAEPSVLGQLRSCGHALFGPPARRHTRAASRTCRMRSPARPTATK
jgi:hypothetical protein